MKTFLLLRSCIIIFILSITSNCFSQTLQWRSLPGVPPAGRYEDIYFIDANTGWTIHFNKVYKTTTGGESWIMYEQQGANANRSIGFFDSQTGIIGTLAAVLPMTRTTNGGVNWSPVTNYSGGAPSGFCGISIVNESTAYACGTYATNGRAYKTTNKGESWDLVFDDTSKARTLIDCYFWSVDSGIIAGGYNTSIFSNGISVVLLTTNGGITWQTVYSSPRTKEWCWKISFINENTGYVSIERAASNGLSYYIKSTNKGISWIEKPFLAYEQEGIGFLNESTGWIGGFGTGTSDSTLETTDGGLTWHNAGWSRSLNRIRFINDTLAYASAGRIHKFSRTKVGVEPIQTIVPERFALHQNFPNPFNPLTMIKFDLTSVNGSYEPAFVKLVVFDQTGKVIRTILSENLNPGSYQVTFDGGYFPSGVYYYRLEAGSPPASQGGREAGYYSETKKMVLLK